MAKKNSPQPGSRKRPPVNGDPVNGVATPAEKAAPGTVAEESELEPEAEAEAQPGPEAQPAEAGEPAGSKKRRKRKTEQAAATPSAEGDSDEPAPGEPSEQDGAKLEARLEAKLEAGGGAGDKLSQKQLVRAVAALLFASHEPMSVARLASVLERPKAARLRKAIATIESELEKGLLPLELREISGGWQLFTCSDQDEVVSRLTRIKKDDRVSPAALETLAVVAYRQPVSKAEIEAIRGVQAGPILRTLVDRGLVRVTGRAEVPGHPLLYGTTKKFLDSFALASLKELPRDGELVRD